MHAMMTDKSPAQLAEDFLAGLSMKFLICHGFGHTFAKPGGKRSKGLFSIQRFEDGSRQMSSKCSECGTIRYRDVRPGMWSFFDEGSYRYDWPDGYLAPAGTSEYLTSQVYKDEGMRRWLEEQEHPTGGEDMPADMAQLAHAS